MGLVNWLQNSGAIGSRVSSWFSSEKNYDGTRIFRKKKKRNK